MEVSLYLRIRMDRVHMLERPIKYFRIICAVFVSQKMCSDGDAVDSILQFLLTTHRILLLHSQEL